MYISVLGFLIGIVSIQFFPVLPSLILFPFFLVLFSLAWYFLAKFFRPYLQFMIMILIGCVWAVFFAQKILAWQLPEHLEGKTITVTGVVSSLPDMNTERIRFEFDVERLNQEPQENPKILLSWYKQVGDHIEMGDKWQLKVRLKRPHGLANPGSFDYEKLLFQKRIRATGYVINHIDNKLIEKGYFYYAIDKFRTYLQKKIENNLSEMSTESLITALVIGLQQKITPSQWEVMRATGTNHLMAISGVHIGFVAGFLYLVIYFLWKQKSTFLLWLPAKQVAALGGLIAAIMYAALAGFSLPAQRAVIMLGVFVFSLFLRQLLGIWNAFALALLIILIWDPLCTFSVSFWLSFGAVFIILYSMNGRIGMKGVWWKYGRVQWVITLGLLPMSLLLFQQTSLISFVANLFAVPVVGFLVLPSALFGTLFLLIYEPVGHIILLFSAKILAYIWQILSWMAHIKSAVWQNTILNAWVLISCIVGILLLISPRGFPARWLGLFGLFPLFYYQPASLKPGEIEFVLLDVGQGLSAFIRTQHHAYLFDAGPKISDLNNAGTRVVLPFLHTKNIRSLDKLVISHGDNDHIGGAFSILKEIPVRHILTSVPQRLLETNVSVCAMGEKWVVDGVTFEMLYPPLSRLNKGNNSSCVLKISTGLNAILLTGDIEKSAEYYLVDQYAGLLRADILVAPHHGSRSSSTLRFIKAIQPTYVLFPVGYKNRYHFPNKLVFERYLNEGVLTFDTAKDGAITFKLNDKGIVEIKPYREQNKRFWR